MSDPVRTPSQRQPEQECSIWGSPSSPKHFDSFSTEELADFYKSLECVVCHELPPKGEVQLCGQKHLICPKCSASVTTCPLCSSPISGKGKAFTDECLAAVAALPIPCKFKFEGCPVKLKVLDLKEHLNSCVHRHIPCIMSKCNETVPFMQLFNHLLNVHGQKVNGVLNCSQHIIEWWIEGDVASTARWPPFYFTCFNNVFLYMCVSTIHGTWEWVWILANNEEAKRFRVETKMENPDKVVSIQWKGPVHSIRKPLKQVITSGEVFVTNSKEIRNPFIYRKGAHQQPCFWRSAVEITQIAPPTKSSIVYIRTEDPLVENTRENFNTMESKAAIKSSPSVLKSTKPELSTEAVQSKAHRSGEINGQLPSAGNVHMVEGGNEIKPQTAAVLNTSLSASMRQGSQQESFVTPSKMQTKDTPEFGPSSQVYETVDNALVESGQTAEGQIPADSQNLDDNPPQHNGSNDELDFAASQTSHSRVTPGLSSDAVQSKVPLNSDSELNGELPSALNVGKGTQQDILVNPSKMQTENTPESAPSGQIYETVDNALVESDGQIPPDSQTLGDNHLQVDDAILPSLLALSSHSGEGKLQEDTSTKPQDGESDDKLEFEPSHMGAVQNTAQHNGELSGHQIQNHSTVSAAGKGFSQPEISGQIPASELKIASSDKQTPFSQNLSRKKSSLQNHSGEGQPSKRILDSNVPAPSSIVSPSKMQTENTPESAPTFQINETVDNALVQSGQVADGQIPHNSHTLGLDDNEVQVDGVILILSHSHFHSGEGLVQEVTSTQRKEGGTDDKLEAARQSTAQHNGELSGHQTNNYSTVSAAGKDFSQPQPDISGQIPASESKKASSDKRTPFGHNLSKIEPSPQNHPNQLLGVNEVKPQTASHLNISIFVTTGQGSQQGISVIPSKMQMENTGKSALITIQMDGTVDNAFVESEQATDGHIPADSQTVDDNQPQDGGSDVELDFATTQTSNSSFKTNEEKSRPNTEPTDEKLKAEER